MILIVKCYYPDYDDEGGNGGTDVIESVYDIDTKLSEAELMGAYNVVINEMVKHHKDYMDNNSKGKLNRMKREIERCYNFSNYLLTEYKNKEVSWMTVS